MDNRAIWVVLFVAAISLAWYFTGSDEPVGENIVVTGSPGADVKPPLSASQNSNSASSSAVMPKSSVVRPIVEASQGATATIAGSATGADIPQQRDSTTAVMDSPVASAPATGTAAGYAANADGAAMQQSSSLIRSVSKAVVDAEEQAVGGATEAVTPEEGIADAEDAVAESQQADAVEKEGAAETVDYQITFKQFPSAPVGAVDLTLHWDANQLAPVNMGAICGDKSGASLFLQGRATANTAKFALLYPNGMGQVSSLLFCRFTATKDSSQDSVVPTVSGELLNVQGSVIGNLSSVLQVTL